MRLKIITPHAEQVIGAEFRFGLHMLDQVVSETPHDTFDSAKGRGIDPQIPIRVMKECPLHGSENCLMDLIPSHLSVG